MRFDGSFSLFPRLFFPSLVQGSVSKQWIIWCEFPRLLDVGELDNDLGGLLSLLPSLPFPSLVWAPCWYALAFLGSECGSLSSPSPLRCDFFSFSICLYGQNNLRLSLLALCAFFVHGLVTAPSSFASTPGPSC